MPARVGRSLPAVPNSRYCFLASRMEHMGNRSSYRQFFSMLGMCLVVLCAPLVAANASTPKPTLADLRHQFALPEQQINFAQAKLVVDRLIDPSINAAVVLRELDQLTAVIRQRTPAGLSKRAELDVLLETLYKPGPWNGNRPFPTTSTTLSARTARTSCWRPTWRHARATACPCRSWLPSSDSALA